MEYNDFRDAKIFPILAPKKESNSDFLQGEDSEIDEIQYINFGDSVIIRYRNQKIAIINATRDKNGKRKYTEIKYLTLGTTETPKFIIECDDNKLFAVVFKSEIKFFSSLNLEQKKNLKLENFDVKFAESPRGTKTLVLFSERDIKIYNLNEMKFLVDLKMPDSEPKRTTWHDHLPGTDIFVSEYTPDSKSRFYSAYYFDDMNPYYCHKSCYVDLDEEIEDNERPCPVNFKPCSKVLRFFFTVLVSFLVFIFVIVLCCIIMILVSSTKNEEEEGEDGTVFGRDTKELGKLTDDDLTTTDIDQGRGDSMML